MTMTTAKLKKLLLLIVVFFSFFCCNVVEAEKNNNKNNNANNNNNKMADVDADMARKKKKKAQLLKQKLDNYHKGKAVIINLHVTHQAGTFLRQHYENSPRGNKNARKFIWTERENRTRFLKQLLPEWDGPMKAGESPDAVTGKQMGSKLFVPDHVRPSLPQHDPNHPYLIEYYKNHPNPQSEKYKTNWDVFYDQRNITYMNWWELNGNRFAWSYHPWSPHGDPFLSHLDWESPHVIAIHVIRNPMDRLLACTPKCLVGGRNKLEDATPDHWWGLANDPYESDNFALRGLTTPYYDISRHGLESAKSLLARMDYILDQSCFNPTLLKFLEVLKWPNVDDLLLPHTKSKSFGRTARDRINNDTLYEYLVEKNALTIELFEWAQSKANVVCADLPPTPNITTTAIEEAPTTTNNANKNKNNKNSNNNNNKKNNKNNNKNNNNNNNYNGISTETVVVKDKKKNNPNPPPPTPAPVAVPVPAPIPVEDDTKDDEQEGLDNDNVVVDDTTTTTTTTNDDNDEGEPAETTESTTTLPMTTTTTTNSGNKNKNKNKNKNNEMTEEEKDDDNDDDDDDQVDNDDYTTTTIRKDDAIVNIMLEEYYVDYLLVFVIGFLVNIFCCIGIRGRGGNNLANTIKGRIDASERVGLISSPSNRLEP